jgi:hypothetical protein
MDIMVIMFGIFSVMMQVLFAYYDSFLTVKQMQSRGIMQGIPLIAHAGIWGDLIFITPLLAYIVNSYRNMWSLHDILLALAISGVVTIGMSILWVKGAEKGLPEAHTYEGKVTPAGYWHALYMFFAVMIIILFYFFSDITRTAASIVSIILGVHVFYGTHIVLGLIGPSWFSNRPHKQPITWATVGICWLLLAWRCLVI